jgi:tripartite-type tricarboxylate transporter receptor subunit TctC
MKLPRHRKFLHLAAGATVLAITSAFISSLTGHGASAQTARTVKIIVPFAPGGGGSVLARVLSDQIEQAQSVTILVENRPGAAAVIGTDAVARAAPDGNSLLITNTSMVTNPHLRKQSYDPLTSFEPVCGLASAPSFITVNSASPYHTLTDFLNDGRAKPGELTMATIFASAPHIGLEMLKRMANVNITFVPFPGSAPAVTALLGGHVTALYDNYATVVEHVSARKLRVLATGWPTRVEALPDVPTVAEAGYKEYGLTPWWGLFAPAKTPKDTVVQLSNWFAVAAQVPEVKNKLAPLGFYPMSICGAEFAALVRKTYDDFGRAIREGNIKAE